MSVRRRRPNSAPADRLSVAIVLSALGTTYTSVSASSGGSTLGDTYIVHSMWIDDTQLESMITVTVS